MEIVGFELKQKPKKIIAFMAITFQILALFSTDIGITEQLKPVFFGIAVFGYSFFILPRLDVWQKIQK